MAIEGAIQRLSNFYQLPMKFTKLLTQTEDNELRAVFLDISCAFDRVWHSGLLFKLRQIGIEGQALDIVKDFLTNREQRVVIDGQFLEWAQLQLAFPKAPS